MKKNEVKVKEDVSKKREVKIDFSDEDLKKIEKISRLDFQSIEEMIRNLLDKKIAFYDDIGLTCDSCQKLIKENEEYYVQESSISKYEKINGEVYEDKVSAWSDKTFCMECKSKFDGDKLKLERMKVSHHNRGCLNEFF